MTKEKVTIRCVDGYFITGELLDVSYNILSGMKWIKVQTRLGIVTVNTEYIISIQYGNSRSSRK